MSKANETNHPPEQGHDKQPNYALRRAMVGAASALIFLGVWKAGELTIDWLGKEEVIGCKTVEVIPGEAPINTVHRAIDEVIKDTNYTEGSARNRETLVEVYESIGETVQPGDRIEACLKKGNAILGEFVTTKLVGEPIDGIQDPEIND